ncbi:cupin domain-containing protein [Chloroflexota bacterium]
MGHFVIREGDTGFMPREFGRSKGIINLENVGAKYLKVHITEYAPGTAHELHRHPGHEEVIFVLDGEGISRTKDGDKPINPGAFAFIPADTDHATINVLKDKPLKAIIVTAPPEE